MTILEIVNKACTRVKFSAISDLFSTSDNQAKEFLGYAEQAASDIMDYQPWRKLIKTVDFVTVSTTNQYALPADFNGFQVHYIYDVGLNLWLPYAADDISLQDQAAKIRISNMPWRLTDNKITFDFALAAGRTLRYVYKSKYYAVSSLNVAKETFTANTDTFVLGEDEALIRGIAYQKSLAYADADLESREKAFKAKLFAARENEAGRAISNVFGRPINRISPVEYQPYGGKV